MRAAGPARPRSRAMRRALPARPHERPRRRRPDARGRAGRRRTRSPPRSASFTGPPHRIELVGEADGVRWFNDSKATTPHAASVAIRAFDSVVLIAGGLNKGLDLAPMADAARGRVRAVVAIGQAADLIADTFARHWRRSSRRRRWPTPSTARRRPGARRRRRAALARLRQSSTGTQRLPGPRRRLQTTRGSTDGGGTT